MGLQESPSSCKEAMAVEFTSPPLTLFLFPRRIRFVIVEYYQKRDSIDRTFEGVSYVRVLRLKNRAVLRSDTYGRGDASAIGCAVLSSWPVPSSEERLLEEYAKGEGMG